MNNVIYYLAAEGSETLPLESGNSILLPKMYDLVWSLIPFAIILIVFWKFVLPAYNKMLQEREDRIEGGLKRAEAQQAEAKAAWKSTMLSSLTREQRLRRSVRRRASAAS